MKNNAAYRYDLEISKRMNKNLFLEIDVLNETIDKTENKYQNLFTKIKEVNLLFYNFILLA